MGDGDDHTIRLAWRQRPHSSDNEKIQATGVQSQRVRAPPPECEPAGEVTVKFRVRVRVRVRARARVSVRVRAP